MFFSVGCGHLHLSLNRVDQSALTSSTTINDVVLLQSEIALSKKLTITFLSFTILKVKNLFS